MARQQGTTPNQLAQNKLTLISTIPPGVCSALVSLYNLGSSGNIYFKTGCGDNDSVSDTDYDDYLIPGELRYIDKPSSGRVIVYCTVAQSTPNLAWHASWEFN